MNFDTISEDQKNRIVDCGLELLAAITDAYGVEEGHATWERVSESVGVEFKHVTFLAMLSGKTTNVVTLYGKGCRTTHNFIEIIKQIRFASGLGLKEAKDMADALDSGALKTLKLSVDVKRQFALTALRSAGLTVT